MSPPFHRSRVIELARMFPAALRARIERSEMLRRALPNTGWLLGDRVVRMAVGMAVSVWVARYLGPEAFGRYNFAIAFALLFGPLGLASLDRVVVRALVKEKEGAGEVLGSALALRLAGSAAAALLAVGTMAALRRGDAELTAMVAILSGGMALQSFDVIDWWNQSRFRSRTTVLATGAGFLIAAGVRVALILTRAPLIAFAWAWSLELALGSLGLLLSHRAGEARLAGWRASAGRAASLAREVWPLLLSSVMVILYTRLDQVLLGQMTRPAELGLYSVAVRLVEVWYLVPAAIVTSVYPGIVALHGRDEPSFHDRLQRFFNLMVAISYAIAIPTSLFAPWIVRLLFGAEYAAAGPLLAVLVWSLPFTSLGLARGAWLNTMGWNREYLITVTIGFAVNLVLNLILIPRLGAMGAVIASCAAYWMAAHGSCFLVPRLVPAGRMLTKALVPSRF